MQASCEPVFAITGKEALGWYELNLRPDSCKQITEKQITQTILSFMYTNMAATVTGLKPSNLGRSVNSL